MRRAQLLNDGLWRCLCPSFEEHMLPKVFKAPFLAPSTKPSPTRKRALRNPNLSQRRRYGTSQSQDAAPMQEKPSDDPFLGKFKNVVDMEDRIGNSTHTSAGWTPRATAINDVSNGKHDNTTKTDGSREDPLHISAEKKPQSGGGEFLEHFEAKTTANAEWRASFLGLERKQVMDEREGSSSSGVSVKKPSLAEERRLARTKPHPLATQAYPNLDKASTVAVIDALWTLRNSTLDGKGGKLANRHDRIVQLVNHLVKNQRYPLDVFVYECMMDAMTDPKGSANGVRKLLSDMWDNRIKPTEQICRSALEALMVHPDYTLRQELIVLMDRFWYVLDTSVAQMIAVGMLRDGQYELAYTKLLEISKGSTKIDLWVYDVFIVEFGRVRFYDEMLYLLSQRKLAKGTDDTFRNLLYHSLETFSQAYHYEGTAFVWNYAVKNSLLNPSDAMLDNVLGTAAKQADIGLVHEVLSMLSSRGKLLSHHSETLVDALAAAEEIARAFETLSAMEENNMKVERDSTRTIYKAMMKNPFLITEATTILSDMHKEREIPFQAVAVTIEALASVRGSEAVMALYNDTLAFSGQRPDAFMMRDLIKHCKEDKTQWAFVKDYVVTVPKDKRALVEDGTFFDMVIPACAREEDFDLAFEFVERAMKLEKSDWRSASWVGELVERAVKAEDARVWPIVDELSEGDDARAGMMQMILQRRRMVKSMEK